MKLFVLNKKNGNKNLINSFSQSAKKKGIEFKEIISEETEDIVINDNDLIYRITCEYNSVILEKKILLTDKKIKTFYVKNNFDLVSRASDNVIDASLLHDYKKIPIPKTKFINNPNNKLIDNIVCDIGGFPVIVKESGGQRGIGLYKVDNKSQLIDITRNLEKNGKSYILREFIDSPGLSYRAIVMGDKVEFCYKNESIDKSDFRSNFVQKNRKRTKYNLNYDDCVMCVNAVKVLGLKTGAVDFAYDKNRKLKIFEVNMPYNFYPVENVFNVDISGKMINCLINK